jgi:hypothetical protein
MKKYNHIQDLFRDLPNTVLLVGNAKMDNKGELIDSYEFVIRFNDFQIEGYEFDVGTKVDAISFHCSDFTMNHTKYLLPNFEKYLDKSHLFTTSDFYTNNSKKEILHMYPNTKIFNVTNKYDSIQGSRLSSGTSLALNLSIFFQKNVHIVGFDFLKTGHYYDKNYDHTNESKKAGINGPAHNGEIEKNILNNIKTIKIID